MSNAQKDGLRTPHLPQAAGLYNPQWEHDACGLAFVADIKGRVSHAIIEQALEALQNMLHRGATGSEANSGDGAGILIQMPHKLLHREAGRLGFELPEPGGYGVGMVFLSQEPKIAVECERLLEQAIEESGQTVLGWRDVPQDNSPVGNLARSGEPRMRQVFVGCASDITDQVHFERKLYLIRRRAEKKVRSSGLRDNESFYICSLSMRTLVYKGMFAANQIPPYFADLRDPDLESSLALVHQRFSTNTFPTWSLAHPFRFLAHNGEINTKRGNVNWMRARESLFESELYGDDLKDLLPVIANENDSDSAILDNALELLVMAGRSLPHAMMMLIPEPWTGHDGMNELQKAFYDFHSSLIEPWDGPAAVAFTDGVQIGAMLDRNGLRPARYYVTKDDRIVFASEVGVLDIPPENILQKGRLEPGKMLLIDTEQGRIVDDAELKAQIATEHPYKKWLAENRIRIEDLPPAPYVPGPDHETVLQREQIFGFTHEDKRVLIAPMARDGQEPVGSMGTDTPVAVLSERPQLLFNYFKQMFAQVTNPPLDAIREELVTSVEGVIGPEQNLLVAGPESCRQIEVHAPILDNEQLAKLKHCPLPGFRARVLPMLFRVKEGAAGLANALDVLCEQAGKAVEDGCPILILSDRDVDEGHAPIPSLLATSAVHHYLVRKGTRTRAGLIIETGDAREVHHYCLLLGYGAGGVNPYLTFETIDDLIKDGAIAGLDHATAVKNYMKAVTKGVLKVMSKMGISTLQSYGGAQIFEAVGLNQDVVDKYFTHTPSQIGGIGLEVIAEEALARHRRAFPDRPGRKPDLEVGGEYQWRRDGEYHLFNPDTVFKLQHSTRTGQYKIFKEYTELVDEQSEHLATLRGLMNLKFAGEPVPLEEVEPVEAIMRRFATGAMSFGSISKEAHESLAIAMNRIGGKSNTGEGGEDPARFVRDENGDWRRSAIKQVASARFGVTSEYLVNADELQIKMAQGAKPGEGGQLPGHKVDDTIAKVRHSTPGVGLISPPPHHDIYSIEDLAQLIYDLKNSNPRARISVKLVAEVGVGTVAAGVAKAYADMVLISGHDGGTGASPLSSLKHAGVPWELGLAETQQVLVKNDLRSRIVIQTDGQLKTGRDVVIAALLGAEEFGFATAPLVVMGCILMRVCHLNTCPVGIATQDPVLRKRFAGKPEFVQNFFYFIAEEVRELMSKLGFRTMDEMIGRTDKLDVRPAINHWKARGLDLSRILYQQETPDGVDIRCTKAQDHGLASALDNHLIEIAKDALEYQKPISAEMPIRNVNRTVGTMLGSEVTRRYGGLGLPDDTIQLKFNGSAGQSFGAFLPSGLTLTLEGDANDYVGKGLSGGRLVIYPPRATTFRPEENILLGNVALYGATGGEAFFNGVAGERFAVRNSGARAVVEGVGDHGCEYMTGGRVVVLGKTGRNFAAGMSGGIAYVLDEHGKLEQRCNRQMVDLEPVTDHEDIETIIALLERHRQLTGSSKAADVLAEWERYLPYFIKVMPYDYRRALREQRERVTEQVEIASEVNDGQ